MAGLSFLVFVALQAPQAPVECRASDDWRSVIGAHVERYSLMEPADLYKLLHQGATGSEHAVESEEAAGRWLARELASLGHGPDEPMVDTIAPEGTMVRIHLRPFLAADGDQEALLAAFVETANSEATAGSGIICALETARDMARDGLLPWDSDALSAFFERMGEAAYPAVHHSDAFTTRYRPAYRVVAGTLLGDVLPRDSR